MRPLPLMAAGLLAATLLTSPTAYAAAETCQGQPATIVGTFLQRDLTGTEGPDVVVTNGAIGVKTLGGDDLVCVTDEPGRRNGGHLDTGAGDDVVDGTWTLAGIDAVLGRAATPTPAPRPGTRWSPATRRSTTRRTRSGAVVGLAAPPAAATRSSPGSRGVPNADVVVLAGIGNEVYLVGSDGCRGAPRRGDEQSARAGPRTSARSRSTLRSGR